MLCAKKPGRLCVPQLPQAAPENLCPFAWALPPIPWKFPFSPPFGNKVFLGQSSPFFNPSSMIMFLLCHMESGFVWLAFATSSKGPIEGSYPFALGCSVTKSGLTLCNPMNCSTPGFPVHHHLLEFDQTHVPWVGDPIQPSHPLSPPSPPDLSLSRHQSLLQWVSSSHQVVKVLELQLQHQSFQWIFRVDFL